MDAKVYAISMMRDEADVARHVCLHLAEELVDGIIVADNLSTDCTRAELEAAKAECAERFPALDFVIVDDAEPGYYQSRKMSALAALAASRGATWIVPFDADEVWASNQYHLGDFLRGLGPDVWVARAPLWNHFGSALDEPGETPFERMVWRHTDVGALPKVAFRWRPGAVVHQGNHGVALGGFEAATCGGLELRHFPYRSWDHFERKARNGAAAYAATDLPEEMGSHWRRYGALLEAAGADALRTEVYEKWFWFRDPAARGCVRDPAGFRRWRGKV